MVRRFSSEDKVTFTAPIEPPTLVPWKQLASSPTVVDCDGSKGHKVFEFLEQAEARGSEGTVPASSAVPEEDWAVALESGVVQDEEGQRKSVERKRRSRGSPMQDKLLLELNWQKNLVKMDEILSDISASNRGEFNRPLFLETFKNKVSSNVF